jgi:hypothetical protein
MQYFNIAAANTWSRFTIMPFLAHSYRCNANVGLARQTYHFNISFNSLIKDPMAIASRLSKEVK